MTPQVGAQLVPVQLQPPNWDIPRQQLQQAFSDKTKFILVNTPHNPTGKVSKSSWQNHDKDHHIAAKWTYLT